MRRNNLLGSTGKLSTHPFQPVWRDDKNSFTTALQSNQGVNNNSHHVNYVFWLPILCVWPLPYNPRQLIFPTHRWHTVTTLFFFFLIWNNMPNIFIALLCVPVWPWPVCSGALISNNNSLSWQPMCKQHSFILTWQPCHSLSVFLFLSLICLRLSLVWSHPLRIFLILYQPSLNLLSSAVCLSLTLMSSCLS